MSKDDSWAEPSVFPQLISSCPAISYLSRQGVYGVRVVQGTGFPDAGEPWIGVMNLGSRPTLAGQTVIAEVHLLDWEGDLCGQTLMGFRNTFLRSQQRLPSLDSLKVQIAID